MVNSLASPAEKSSGEGASEKSLAEGALEKKALEENLKLKIIDFVQDYNSKNQNIIKAVTKGFIPEKPESVTYFFMVDNYNNDLRKKYMNLEEALNKSGYNFNISQRKIIGLDYHSYISEFLYLGEVIWESSQAAS